MILNAERLIRGYPFVARRFGRGAHCDPDAVRAAIVQAVVLAAGVELEEPAAVFFAFAGSRRAFPFAWKLMAGYLADAQARANGLSVAASADVTHALCEAVAAKRITWPEVRAWFAARLTSRL